MSDPFSSLSLASTSSVSLRQLGGWALFAAGSLLGLGDAARWMLSHG